MYVSVCGASKLSVIMLSFEVRYVMQVAQADFDLGQGVVAPKGSLIMPSIVAATMQVCLCLLRLPFITRPVGSALTGHVQYHSFPSVGRLLEK
jgi:hypothetical protein